MRHSSVKSSDNVTALTDNTFPRDDAQRRDERSRLHTATRDDALRREERSRLHTVTRDDAPRRHERNLYAHFCSYSVVQGAGTGCSSL